MSSTSKVALVISDFFILILLAMSVAVKCSTGDDDTR